jgi:hypothetical protein
MKIYQALQRLLVRDLKGRQTDWRFDKRTFIYKQYGKNYEILKGSETLFTTTH